MTTLQMLAQRIDEEAKFLAVGVWNTTLDEMKRFLDSKRITLPEAEALIGALRQAEGTQATTTPPPELVTEIKKRVIANMLRKDK